MKPTVLTDEDEYAIKVAAERFNQGYYRPKVVPISLNETPQEPVLDFTDYVCAVTVVVTLAGVLTAFLWFVVKPVLEFIAVYAAEVNR